MRGEKRCPKCDARMVEGHLLERDYGSIHSLRWQPGSLERTWFGSIKTRKQDLRDVTNYACERCGLIETYRE